MTEEVLGFSLALPGSLVFELGLCSFFFFFSNNDLAVVYRSEEEVGSMETDERECNTENLGL